MQRSDCVKASPPGGASMGDLPAVRRSSQRRHTHLAHHAAGESCEACRVRLSDRHGAATCFRVQIRGAEASDVQSYKPSWCG